MNLEARVGIFNQTATRPFFVLFTAEYEFLGVVHSLRLVKPAPGDSYNNAAINMFDLKLFHQCLSGSAESAMCVQCLPLDMDTDGEADLADFAMFQQEFGCRE